MNWAVVDERAIGRGPHENQTWFNGGTPYAVNGVIASPETSSLGMVRVAAGAVLNLTAAVPVSGLVVDATAGAGSINRLQLASGGTLDLVNVSGELPIPFDVPLTITDALSGPAASWTVCANGEPLKGRRLRICGNKLQVMKNGLVILVK